MQFLDILKLLPDTGKVIFIILLLSLSAWMYRDAEKRGIRGWLWASIIFLFPMLLPVYIIVRPKHFIAFCKKCYRILPEDSSECYFCKEAIPDGGGLSSATGIEVFQRYLNGFLLDLCRTSDYFMGLCLFLFKKKFFLLNINLSSLYSWGTCHQIVATEGRYRDIPINTLTKIFTLAGITKEDVFYDLGSGTGNVVFFANILYGIEALGIDAIETFIDYSNKIKKALSFDKVTFIKGNFLEADFSKATVIYTVSTAFDINTRKNLAEKFKETAGGTRIITVTHRLDVPHLEVKAEKRILFSWGYENVYFHVRL